MNLDERLPAHFDAVFSSLKDYEQGLFDGAFRASSVLILVIGWLLTSKEARAYLAANGLARGLCAAAVGAGSLVYSIVSWRVYLLSQARFAELAALQYLPPSVYVDHRINAGTVALVIGQNIFLTLVACMLMLSATARRSGDS